MAGVVLSLNRRQLAQLAILVFAGLVVRLWLFMDVGVNGDTGLYLYDAKQILWGNRLMVDFPSRSPVFEYALAGVLSLGYSPLVSARVFMVTVGMVLGLAIYTLTRTIHSHRAGLTAAALFYLTPFSAVWGLWVKTEQAAAVFLIAAFIIALAVVDRQKLPTWSIVAVGFLFGVAFLIRRVAIVHIGAFALFMLYYRARHVQEWRSTLAAAAGVVGVALLVLLTAYAALAGFDPGLTADIANAHGGTLFSTDGQGGLGWTEVTEAQAAQAEDRSHLLAAICQKCGNNTIIVFMSTMFVVFPVLIVLLIFLRSYMAPAGFVGNEALPIVFILLSLYGLITLVGSQHWTRGLTVATFVGAVYLIWTLKPVPWDRLWQPKMALPALVLFSLTAGYLYRDRILYVTYFQDFYPYLVTLAGISAVEFLDTDFDIDSRRLVVGAAAALFAMAMLVGAVNAYPYQGDMSNVEQASWFSVELVQSYGEDIEDRTEPNELILTTQPLYIIETDRRLVNNLSRRYYLHQGWPHTDKADEHERILVQAVQSERVSYVIYNHELRDVYNTTDTLQPAVNCRFQPVKDQGLYNRTAGTLLKRKPNASACSG